MNRRKILTLLVLLVFILSSFLPMVGVNAATNETITLNSSLYKAVKADLEKKLARVNEDSETLVNGLLSLLLILKQAVLLLI